MVALEVLARCPCGDAPALVSCSLLWDLGFEWLGGCCGASETEQGKLCYSYGHGAVPCPCGTALGADGDQEGSLQERWEEPKNEEAELISQILALHSFLLWLQDGQ